MFLSTPIQLLTSNWIFFISQKMNNIQKIKSSSEEKTILILETMIQIVSKKTKTTLANIEEISKKLELHFEKDIKYLIELEFEINKLRSALQLVPKKDIEDTNKNIDSDLKKIYKMIASRCHPDKTNNKRLNSIFIEATNAYNKFNYSTLFSLFDRVLDSDSDNFNEKISNKIKIEHLEIELKRRHSELKEINETKGYMIWKLYTENEMSKSKKLFIDSIYLKIFEFESLKKQLEQNLSKGKQTNEFSK